MSDSWSTALGEAIREWRVRELGAQKLASECLSVHQSALSRWESGQCSPDLVAMWRAGARVDALLTRAAQIEKASLATEAIRSLAQKLHDRPDLLARVQEILEQAARAPSADDTHRREETK